MSEVQETQEVTGVGFAIATFSEEKAADQALKAMKQAKKDGQLYYKVAAVIRKETDGDVHYHETGDMSTGKGAGIGALIGGVVGLLGGPIGVAVGAGAGALVGGVAAHGDAGFSDKSLKALGAALKPGTSAVMAITSEEFLKAFRKEVNLEDVWNLVSTIASRISDRQAQGRDVMIGIGLTDQGFVVGELSADDQIAEVISVAVTGEGVAAVDAVATDEGVEYQAGVATDEGVATETGVATDDAAAVVDTVTTDEGTEVEGAAVEVEPEEEDN